MTLKAVIFDLDNTLYDEASYFAQIIEAFEIAKGLARGSVASGYSRELRQKSQDILSDLLHRAGQLSRDNHDLFFTLYHSHPATLVPYSGAIDTLIALKQQGLKVALLTNGLVTAQQNKINALGLTAELDHIEFARAQGRNTEKPHPAPFLRALEALELDANDALMIGDDLEKDIYPALKLGMQAIWRTEQKAHQLPLKSIRQVSELLELI